MHFYKKSINLDSGLFLMRQYDDIKKNGGVSDNAKVIPSKFNVYRVAVLTDFYNNRADFSVPDHLVSPNKKHDLPAYYGRKPHTIH